MHIFSFIAEFSKFSQDNTADKNVSGAKLISELAISCFENITPFFHNVQALENSVDTIVPLDFSFI